MILGEIARLERMLVLVTVKASEHHKTLFAMNDSEPHRVVLTDKRIPDCLFENRKQAEDVAYQLEQWGVAAASVRRVSIVTMIEDARPEA